ESITNKAGDNLSSRCRTVAERPFAFWTSIATSPSNESSGARALICVGLTYAIYASFPRSRTDTPSNAGGRRAPEKSLAVQLRAVGAKFAPMMVIHEFGAMAGRKLAPLTTLAIIGGLGAGFPPVSASL